jgi:hypothetical protein
MGHKDTRLCLNLSTKMGNKIWWWMHFQGKMKILRPYFVLFPFYKVIGWKKHENNLIQQIQQDPSALDKFVWNNSLWYKDHLYENTLDLYKLITR